MVLSTQRDGIAVARVVRQSQGRAKVEFAHFYAGAQPAAATLEKIAKEARASQYACSHLLSQGEYQLLLVEAPNVAREELKMAVRWRIKDLLDFHVDDATIDVLDIPMERHAARAHSMYVIAARNQLIQQRQTVFEEASIPLSVIDIPEMAQRNIAALLEPEARGVALLSFDATGGLLTVTYDSELYLSRRLDVGYEQFAGVQGEQWAERLERVTLEVQRSLDHCERQYHFITLSKLLLAPMEPELAENLRESLAANLYLPVELLDLEAVFDVSAVAGLAAPRIQQQMFFALGAGLRHEEIVL